MQPSIVLWLLRDTGWWCLGMEEDVIFPVEWPREQVAWGYLAALVGKREGEQWDRSCQEMLGASYP